MHAAFLVLAILAAQTAPDTPEAEALRKRLIQDRIKTQFLKREEASILQGLENLDRQLW